MTRKSLFLRAETSSGSRLFGGQPSAGIGYIMVLHSQQVLIGRPIDETLVSAFVPTATKVESSVSSQHPHRMC